MTASPDAGPGIRWPLLQFRAPFAWSLLLAAGQAATLAFVNAGPRVGYQHYIVPWQLPADAPRWALAVFVIEIGVVLWGIATTNAARHALRGVRGWRLAVVAGLMLLTSATGSQYLPAFGAELVFATFVQLVHLGAVVMVATSIPVSGLDALGAAFERMAGPGRRAAIEPGGPDRFAWILAACVFAAASLLAIFVYERHPHVPDEVSYLIQAQYLATGRLAMAAPPVADAFSLDLMTYQAERWFSPFPPGWPAILAIAASVGATWFLNPLLGGVNILLAATVLREIYPRRTARLTIILLAASPWHLFMSMSLMSHNASLAAALAGAAAVARLRRDPRARWAILGGACIGVVGLIRPLEAIPVALALGLWSLGAHGRRIRLLPSALLTTAAIATSLLVLPYNRHLTGSSRTFPVMAYMDATYGKDSNALGFGPERGPPFAGLDPFPGHNLRDVALNADFNLFQINTELLGWATGSLLVIGLLLVSGRTRRPDWAMIAVAASVAGVHSFYYFSGGPDFGARYWYLSIVPLVALAARGIEESARAADDAVRGGKHRVLLGSGILTAVMLTVFVPWRATDKYLHYRGMQPHIREAIPTPAHDALVLVRGRRHPDYASAAVHNPLDLHAPATIYAWDRGRDTRTRVVAAYPSRTFWLVDGPTVTGSGYRVRAGPLTAAQLLERADSNFAW